MDESIASGHDDLVIFTAVFYASTPERTGLQYLNFDVSSGEGIAFICSCPWTTPHCRTKK